MGRDDTESTRVHYHTDMKHYLALLCLLVPALLVDADGRGLHDRLTGTAVVRER